MDLSAFLSVLHSNVGEKTTTIITSGFESAVACVYAEPLLLHFDTEKTTELDFSLEDTLEVRSLDRFHVVRRIMCRFVL